MGARAWQRAEFSRYKAWRSAQPALEDLAQAAVASPAGPAAARGFSIDPMAFLPLSFLSIMVLVGLAVFHLRGVEEPVAIGLTVTTLRGSVKATDGMKDWDLEVGSRVYPGQRVLTGKDGAVKFQGTDPDASVLVYEGSRFHLDRLEEVPSPGLPAYKLRGNVEAGEVVMKFRSQQSLWGVELKLPLGVSLFCRKVIMFKVALEATGGGEVVVGDGVVAAVGPDGEKSFIKADQKMKVNAQQPVSKPAGANVLGERWSL